MEILSPRAFFDANIFIRGTAFPRFAYEVLRRAALGECRPVVSPTVLESVRYYVSRLFPGRQGALEAMLTHLGCEVVPDPSPEDVRRHLRVMRVGSFLREVLGCSSEYLSTIERRAWAQAGAPFWEE